MAFAAVAWWGLARLLANEHRADDGIVGVPALRNYSEPREKMLYLGAHALAALGCGALCALLARLRRTRVDTAGNPPPAASTRPDQTEPAAESPQDGTRPPDAAQCSFSPTAPAPGRSRRWFGGLAIAVAIYAIFAGIAARDAPFDGFHEGVRLNYAQAALEHKVPYRDFDCLYGLWYGVGQHLVAFKLFGEVSALSARRLGELLAPLLPVAMYFVCSAAVRRRLESWLGLGLATLLIFAPPYFIGWPVDSQSLTTRHAWAPALLALLLVYLRARKPTLLFLAGIGTAVACLWPLQTALVPAAAIGGTLLLLCFADGWGTRSASRALAVYLAGLALGLAPIVLYLALNEALVPFLQYHAKILRIHASWNGQPFPRPDRWPLVVFLYLPPALTCMSAGWLAAALVTRRFSTDLAGLASLALASFAQFYAGALYRSDGVHGASSSFMHVPLLLCMLNLCFVGRGRDSFPADSRLSEVATHLGHSSRRVIPGWFSLTARLLLTALCLLAAAFYIALRIHRYGTPDQYKNPSSRLARLHGVSVWVGDIPRFDQMGRYILENTAPGRPILDLSDWFSAHFLYDRPATGRLYFSYDAVSPADQQHVCDNLRATAVAVVPLRQQGIDGIPPGARYHVIMERVLADFVPDFELDGYVAMRRRRPAAEPAPHSDWLRLAPRVVSLGFLPYFGSQLFAQPVAPAAQAEPQESSKRPRAGSAPIPIRLTTFSPTPGRRRYPLPLPPSGTPPRLLSLEIASGRGPDTAAALSWAADRTHSSDDFVVYFQLGTSPRPHTYWLKLASFPQWVWAKDKTDVRVEIPPDADLLAAFWE